MREAIPSIIYEPQPQLLMLIYFRVISRFAKKKIKKVNSVYLIAGKGVELPF